MGAGTGPCLARHPKCVPTVAPWRRKCQVLKREAHGCGVDMDLFRIPACSTPTDAMPLRFYLPGLALFPRRAACDPPAIWVTCASEKADAIVASARGGIRLFRVECGVRRRVLRC